MGFDFDNFRRRWLVSITAKLLIGVVLLIGAMSIFIFVFFPNQLEKQAMSMLGQKADETAVALSFAISNAVLENDQQAAARIMNVARQIKDLDYLVVHDLNNNIFCSLNLDSAQGHNYFKQSPDTQNDCYPIIRPIMANNQRIGDMYIGLSLDYTQSLIEQSRKNAAGIGIFFLVVSIFGVLIMRKYFVPPILEITNKVKQVASGNIWQRISTESNDEIGILAKTINAMIDNWETSRQEWGILNKGLEQRVTERTHELEEEINERKRAEEELRTFMSKLERSNRELEDFAFVASHDLQEPLRKVQAFGDRLKAVCGNELSPKAADYLERMQSAASRMQILIKDLLTFSRVTSKAQPFVKVNMRQTLDEVLLDMEVTIEKMGGTVEIGELCDIEADALQMRQLFQNLIGNALKFHKPDVAPQVKIYSDILPENRAGSNGKPLCHIMVEDNGIGFEEKYLDRIFTVFQRLHGRSEYEGTGLGLAVVRKIVERHGGTITAKSSPGNGAKFIATMPLVQNETERATSKISAVKQNNDNNNNKPQPKLPPIANRGMETSFMVPCP